MGLIGASFFLIVSFSFNHILLVIFLLFSSVVFQIFSKTCQQDQIFFKIHVVKQYHIFWDSSFAISFYKILLDSFKSVIIVECILEPSNLR